MLDKMISSLAGKTKTPAGEKVDTSKTLSREEMAKLSKDELIEYCMKQQALVAAVQHDEKQSVEVSDPQPEAPAAAPAAEEPPPVYEDPLHSLPEVKKQIDAIANNEASQWNNPGAKLGLGDGSMPPDMERTLMNALKNNTSLQICGLHRMSLDDTQLAQIFVPGETKLTKVKFLVLYHNTITDVGLMRLIETVKAGALPALEVLGLNNNKCTLDTREGNGLQALLDAITTGIFPSLRQLYLMGNPISADGKNAIMAACAQKKINVYLPIAGNDSNRPIDA